MHQEVIQCSGVCFRRQVGAEPLGKGRDPRPTLGHGEHAAQDRKSLGGQEFGHHTVRRDHEVLDQLLGAILFVRAQVLEDSIIDYGASLDRFQTERAALMPYPLQGLSDLVLHA